MSQFIRKDKEASIGQILAKVGELKALPQVVFQVLAATEADMCSAADLERQISVDPGLSTRVLSQANSSFYALPKKVTSIKDAVMLLGFKQIREVTLSASVSDMFIGKNDKESVRRRDWWRHSVNVATICSAVADLNKGVSPPVAYTAGLLCYIGKTLIDQSDSAAYDRVLQAVAQGSTERFAEESLFRCDHIDIAIAVGEKWKLPENILAALNYEDEPSEEAPANPLRAVVVLSSLLANHVEQPDAGFDIQLQYRQWAFQELKWEVDKRLELLLLVEKLFAKRKVAA